MDVVNTIYQKNRKTVGGKMKIIREKKIKIREEAGKFQMVDRFPMAGRKKLGMKTICDYCGLPIEDEYFIGALTSKKGTKNYKFHETCYKKGNNEKP